MKLKILINKIKERPDMYICSRSVSFLRAFLNGYSLGLKESELSEFQSEMEGFQRWIYKQYGFATNQSWNQIILFISPNEDQALDHFFELFERYLEFVVNKDNGT